jgi:hypothetical protein
MPILCDTSVILMLIRIAPDMFLDNNYGCCTIRLVRDELFRTHKFKTKYPWRSEYKAHIRCLTMEVAESEEVQRYLNAIQALTSRGIVNEKTGREFGLSHVDKVFLSCALANGLKISTGEKEMKLFAAQEFGKQFKGWISPLGMINSWIRSTLIRWDDLHQSILREWEKDNEHAQPQRQKGVFRKLTGIRYPGP